MDEEKKHRCRSRGKAAAPEENGPLSMREVVQLMNGLRRDVAKTSDLERFVTTAADHRGGKSLASRPVGKKVDDVRQDFNEMRTVIDAVWPPPQPQSNRALRTPPPMWSCVVSPFTKQARGGKAGAERVGVVP